MVWVELIHSDYRNVTRSNIYYIVINIYGFSIYYVLSNTVYYVLMCIMYYNVLCIRK